MTELPLPVHSQLEPRAVEIYQAAIAALHTAEIPFLVGGAYAMKPSTGIERHTKDLDVFVKPGDIHRALETLRAAGFKTELTFPHWLGKAYLGDHFIDLIFSSGNGVAIVDDDWFAYARESIILGASHLIVPPEEMLWSKSFVTERERYDGADIAHLLRSCSASLDWDRLLRRFSNHWRVLLSNLVLFGFIYPAHRNDVPRWVMSMLLARLQQEQSAPAPETRICNGTLISREQYLIDINEWGYDDGRLQPEVHMTPDDIQQWTNAIKGAHNHA